MIDVDAFEAEFLSSEAPFPLSKCTISVESLLKGLCKTIELIPSKKEDCIHLVELLLSQFYDRCFKRCYRIGTHLDSVIDETTFKASFTWSQNMDEIELLRNKLIAIDLEVFHILERERVIYSSSNNLI